MQSNPQDKYDGMVKNFLFKTHGCILVVSSDLNFTKLFRNAIKHIDDKFEHVIFLNNTNETIKTISNIRDEYKIIIIVIESTINGKSTVHIFKQIKNDFYECTKLICTTPEVDRKTLIYLSEIGADNVIIKPVTMNCIIQKLALTINPNNNISKLVDGVRNLINKGELAQASKLVEYIFREKPGSTVGYILMGDIHKKNNEFDKAEFAYKVASNNSKLYIEPLKKLAELFHETGDTSKKLEYLKQLDTLSPLNHIRKIEIGESHLELGDNERAKFYFGEGVKLLKKSNDESMSNTLMEIGLKLKDKDPQSSLEYMEQAVSIKDTYLSKDDIWMINEIGIHLRKAGKRLEAIEYYKKALTISKNDGAIHYNIGMAYTELNRHEEALKHFEMAVNLTPEILRHGPQVSYNIGRVYKVEDRLSDALKFFQICYDMDNSFKDVSEEITILNRVLNVKMYDYKPEK